MTPYICSEHKLGITGITLGPDTVGYIFSPFNYKLIKQTITKLYLKSELLNGLY